MAVRGLLCPLLPALHPQAVALDDIGGGIGAVLGILQGAPGGLRLLLRGLLLGMNGRQLPVHVLLTALHLLQSGG